MPSGRILQMADNETVTKLKLLSSHNEVGNVRTFIFETGGLKWTAGQALGYTLPQAGDKDEENQRWFTIASSPIEGEIHISTRVSQSKFKQALNALKPGDEILSHDLEGEFTWEENTDEHVVLVAGGIGITPYRSILISRQAERKPLSATLLYFNRDNDVPFREELQAIQAKNPDLKITIVIGEEISADSIVKHAPQSARQTVYLSGPEPMVEKVGKDLRDRAITIKQDWFPGYDEKSY
jgi:ferredoxin-NADP reductase